MPLLVQLAFALPFCPESFLVSVAHFPIEGHQLLNFLLLLFFLDPELMTVESKGSIELEGVLGLFASWAIRDVFNSKVFLLKRDVV